MASRGETTYLPRTNRENIYLPALGVITIEVYHTLKSADVFGGIVCYKPLIGLRGTIVIRVLVGMDDRENVTLVGAIFDMQNYMGDSKAKFCCVILNLGLKSMYNEYITLHEYGLLSIETCYVRAHTKRGSAHSHAGGFRIKSSESDD